MMDNLNIFKRGEDAWDVTCEGERIAAIRSGLGPSPDFTPLPEWTIRTERATGQFISPELLNTREVFPTFQAAFAHICLVGLK